MSTKRLLPAVVVGEVVLMEVFTKTKVKDDPSDFLYTPRKNGEKVGAGQKYQNWRNEHPPITTGWRPSCSCTDAEIMPCVVLVPFGGSGTVAKVSRDLGRKSILIELSADYIKISRERLRLNEQLPLGDVTV